MHDPDALPPETDANLMRLLDQLAPTGQVPKIIVVSTPSSRVDRFADLFHASSALPLKSMTVHLMKDSRAQSVLRGQTDGLHPVFVPRRPK